YRAVGDPPGEVRLILPEQLLLDEGMNAIGRNDGVGFDRFSIGKSQRHAAIGTLIDAHHAVVEMDQLIRDSACKRGMKVAAMAEQVRRAVARFSLLAEDHVEAHLAGIVFPVVPGTWIKRTGAHQTFKAEPT